MPCAIGPFVLASDVCTIRIPRPRSTFLDERRKIISPRSFDRVVQPRRAFKNSRIKRIFFLKNYSINNKLYPRYIRISKFHRKVKESEISFFSESRQKGFQKKKKKISWKRTRFNSRGFARIFRGVMSAGEKSVNARMEDPRGRSISETDAEGSLWKGLERAGNEKRVKIEGRGKVRMLEFYRRLAWRLVNRSRPREPIPIHVFCDPNFFETDVSLW